MGQIAFPGEGPVYFDANVLIYTVEGIEPYASLAQPLWDAVDAGDLAAITSQLTLLEVLVRPLREGDAEAAARFREILLCTVGVSCRTVDLTILESAARVRAAYRLRTPDAVHAATAVASGCNFLLTNDPCFRRVPDLNVLLLSDLVAQPEPRAE